MNKVMRDTHSGFFGESMDDDKVEIRVMSNGKHALFMCRSRKVPYMGWFMYDLKSKQIIRKSHANIDLTNVDIFSQAFIMRELRVLKKHLDAMKCAPDAFMEAIELVKNDKGEIEI